MKKIIFFVFSAVITIWICWAAQEPIVEGLGFRWNAASVSPWASSFISLNALFAALGFGGVVLTLYSQQTQLKSSKRRQHLDQFDKTFFQMLDLLIANREKVIFAHSRQYAARYSLSKRELREGARAFRLMWNEVYARVRARPHTREEVARIYDLFVHGRYEWSSGPYFRLIYAILKRIHTDEVLRAEERIMYGNLLRGQLSSYEIAVLGFNGLSKVAKDLKFYLEEYNFFKYLPEESNRRQVLLLYYARKSFQGREEQPKSFFRRKPVAGIPQH